MAGLYIHIPFCRKACFYCNFHFSVNQSGLEAMLEAMLLEAETEGPNWQQHEFTSLYLGGGTPSLVSGAAMTEFLDALRRIFRFAETGEWTLEANPDDVTAERALSWRAAGINRVSLGIQSFSDEELRWMNRAHHAAQSEMALKTLLDTGIHSVNVDLIYGSPLLSDRAWTESLRRVFDSGADHLSAYALTLETDTPYKKLVQQGKYPAPEEETQSRHFDILMNEAAAAGWEQYEISNLCKPGSRARHNSAYWNQEPYLGIGPSAHSFDGERRMWNIADNKIYMEQAARHTWSREIETPEAHTRLNELIMTRIRLLEGLNLEAAEQLFPGFKAQSGHELQRIRERGWAFMEDGFFRLTPEGRHFADAIASSLMLV
ncbi:MAG: radical SAM family heme chaperone HemW [Bacteroidetes bacterium]|nr:radical SAM family heme chaperone HemW [Bacteroidota bacterium]